jgi:heme/copper-type cytochrome/quinol oxidase subunit 2
MNQESNLLGYFAFVLLALSNFVAILGLVFLTINKSRPNPRFHDALSIVWWVIVLIGVAAIVLFLFKTNLFKPHYDYGGAMDFYAKLFLAPMCLAGVLAIFLRP